MKHLVLSVMVMFFLAACQTGDSGSQAGTPFLGGTQGLVLSFADDTPPGTVFDKGTFPFDVVVKVDNKGEFEIPKNKIFIDVLGFEPNQFGMSAAALSKSPDDNLLARTKDVQGNVIEPGPAFVEFPDLNYQGEVAGSELSFKVRAQACYLYGTFATTQLCSRQNVINPAAGGICEVNEDKQVYNSGAPVQVRSVVEQARAKDKIGITFEITHVGTGKIFQRDHLCDNTVRTFEDKVFVEVQSPLPGMTCTGLQAGYNEASGFATLYGGTKTITCTQPLATPRDYEFPVTISLTYDYNEGIDTDVVVKHTVG